MVQLFGISIPNTFLVLGSPLSFLLGVLASKILPYEWRRYRQSTKEREQAVDEWYLTAKEMVTQISHIGRRTTITTELDYELMAEQIDPYSERLQSHAVTAPDGVDEEAIEAVNALAGFTTSASVFAEMGERQSGIAYLQEAIELAERTKSEEHDIEDVNNFVAAFGNGEPQSPEISDDEIDMEELDAVVEHLKEQYGEDGLQEFEDFLEFPWEMFEDVLSKDVWEEMVREAIRYYMQLLLVNLGDHVYEELETLHANHS